MNDLILLEVNDNGMSIDRLLKGDKVNINKVFTEINETDIFAIVHKSCVILRRIKKIKDGFVLLPSNKQYSNVFTSTLVTLGKVERAYIRY